MQQRPFMCLLPFPSNWLCYTKRLFTVEYQRVSQKLNGTLMALHQSKQQKHYLISNTIWCWFCWHSLTHTEHPLTCRWRKKMRGRRTQEEHTKWSCSFSLYRHTGQSENLQDMTLQYNTAMTITCTTIYCYHAATCSGYYAQQSFAAQE